jgi:hypothetical protein
MSHFKLFVVECVEPEVELDEVREDRVQVRVQLQQHHLPAHGAKGLKASFF